MGVARILIGLLLVLGASACGSSSSSSTSSSSAGHAAMPNVVGKDLGAAKAAITEAGFGGTVQVTKVALGDVGGGSSWRVCAQSPAAGAAVKDPRLTVGHSCGVDLGSAASAAASAGADGAANGSSGDSSAQSSPGNHASVDAGAAEKAYERKRHASSIASMCNGAHTNWPCFYKGVHNDGSKLRITLATPSGWSAAARSKLAAGAATDWYDYIGCDYPDLDLIIVRVNGVDHAEPRDVSVLATGC